MMLAFVLIAGSLAAGAAVLLLLPLLRRRADARPASAVAAVAVLLAMLLGGAGLYAAFSNYAWVDTPGVGDTPAAMAAQTRASGWPPSPDDRRRLAAARHVPMRARAVPLARARLSARRPARQGQNAEAIMGMAEALLAQDLEAAARRARAACSSARWSSTRQSRKALFYSAFAALGRGEPPLARQRFQRMLALNPPPGRARHHREANRRASTQRSAARRRRCAAPRRCDRRSEDRGARHAGAGAGGARCPQARAVRRGARSEGAGTAVRREAPAGDVSPSTWNSRPRTPCSNRAASRPDSNSKWSRAWRSAELRPRPAATRSDKLAIMSARTDKLNIVIDRLAP